MTGSPARLLFSIVMFSLLQGGSALAHAKASVCERAIGAEAAAPADAVRLAQADAAATDAAPAEEVDKAALARELSQMLQACSFDGQSLTIAADALERDAGSDLLDQVDRIMQATGLPQNFEVVAAPVPNAAAMIVVDGDNIPRRVIAYNPDFMAEAQGGDAVRQWIATSIMAHEIGHHLSGHTLVPGGSLPPLELEADRFSGFVLARLGASQSDAKEAVRTLVGEPDTPTHPGRAKRLDAIGSGWQDACAQGCEAAEQPVQTAGATPKPEGTDAATPTAQDPGAGVDEIMAQLDQLGGDGDSAAPQAAAQPDNLPVPDPAAVPRKFSQFVYDTTGRLNAEERAQIEQAARAFAADPGVEIVTILTDDLHGMTGQQYAETMLAQMRVGKLDVGNGAVAIAAPGAGNSAEDEAGLALGPGLVATMGGRDVQDQMRQSLVSFAESVRGEGDPGVRTIAMGLTAPASRIMRDATASNVEWFVRYPTLADGLQAKADYDASGQPYDPATDPLYEKVLLAQVTYQGTIPAAEDGTIAAREALLGPRLDVTATNGQPLVVHADPIVQDLMPVKLEPGKTYQMVLRMTGTTDDQPAGVLLSYDEMAAP